MYIYKLQSMLSLLNQCLPVNVHSSFISIAELEGVGFNESLLKLKHPWLCIVPLIQLPFTWIKGKAPVHSNFKQ